MAYPGTSGFSLLSLLVLSAALLTAPVDTRASHLSQVPENCIDCHSLDSNEGESGTSYISSASRTLPTMKSLNGFVAPDSFGCTYCHSNDLNGTMKGILTHFGFKNSKHPVGKIRGGLETQNEYLSTWDTNFVNELDCIDCHDPLLVIDQNPANLALAAPYANHVTPNTGSRVGNPSMLRASGVMTDLCRGCHGAAPAVWWTGRGKANPPALVDHDEVALAENDTTPLKTSDCADCHDTHYSNNSKLFNDGHEDTAINMGDVSECVTCHYRGDADDNYITHGHGMANATSGTPLNFGCGSCHNVNAQHDGTNPKMLNFLEQGGPSVFGKSLESVCYICHGGYDAHTGGADNVGCLDCHDEHAEGSGPASNLYMIPTNLPNNHGSPDAVFFEDNGPVAGNYDYYRAAGDGLCDNQTCHQGLTTATGFDLWPLSGLMGTGPVDTEHSGDYETDNTDCNGCHTHTDTNGSWGAGNSCDTCHPYPPNTPAHDKHVNASGIRCSRCHQNPGTHNETGVADAAEYASTPIATIRGNVDVVFDSFNSGGTYGPGGAGAGTCTNLYCHGDTAAVPDGTDPTPEWNNSVTGSCGTCHSDTAPGTNSHSVHLSADGTFGITIGCVDCHTSSAAVTTHVNGEPTFAGAATAYSGTVDDRDFTAGPGTCGTNSCHNDGKNAAPRTAYSWGTSITNCRECHGDDAASHTAEAHSPHIAYLASISASLCGGCHDVETAATHIDGTIDIDGGLTYGGDTEITGSTFGNCLNIDCHGGSDTPDWDEFDSEPPAWTVSSNIGASDPGTNGVLTVTWAAAADAFPSDPVVYDLYMSDTNSSAAVFASPTHIGLADPIISITGLTNGTPYYFGVRARDSWIVPNVTTNIDISTGVSPTDAPPGGTTVRYYLNKSEGVDYGGTYPSNLGDCGTPVTGTASGNTDIYPPNRGILGTAEACTANSTGNRIELGDPAGPGAYENWVAFYHAVPFTEETVVQGTHNNNVGYRGATGNEDMRWHFAIPYLPTWIWNTVSITYADLVDIGTSTAARNPDLSGVSITVPAGARFGLYVRWAGVGTVSNPDDFMMLDSYSPAVNTSYIEVEQFRTDKTAPDWTPSGVSGITVVPGSDGRLLVDWNAAVDSGPPSSPPVLYNLYRKEKTAPNCTDAVLALWTSPYQLDLGATSYEDSGVAPGIDYCYGVLAKDSNSPVNVRQATDAAFGQASSGSGFGCDSCHDSPPTSAESAGKHEVHANNDGDYSECDNCHPGASAYDNDHTDGIGQLAFDGSAAVGDYTGGELTYTDGVTIYQDTDGYGTLTGSAGDGVDDGSCFNTPAAQCHNNGATAIGWGTTAPAEACSNCHNSGQGATEAPVVIFGSSSHTSGAPGCTGCHAGHFQGVRIPLPPASWSDPSGRLTGADMQARTGIDYTTAGGIDLGGTGTVPSISNETTEAEICWGCHDDYVRSEWGFNTKTTPSGYPVVQFPVGTGETNQQSFNYGWLFEDNTFSLETPNWVAGGTGGSAPAWRSPYANNLTMRVVSAHSANFDPVLQRSSVADNVQGSGAVSYPSPVLESAADLRCSYCHDVHQLNRGSFDSGTGSGEGGPPYLRGAWIGNPYPPDLPPEDTYNYPGSGGPAGIGSRLYNQISTPMPRVFADNPLITSNSSSRGKGGFFIDQNSNAPGAQAAMNTYGEVAELCQICHGTTVDDMDFYPSRMWRTSNGHSNSTVGGTGAYKMNLFNPNSFTTWDWMGNQGRQGLNKPMATGPWAYLLNQPGPLRATGWYKTGTAGSTIPQSGDPYFDSWYTSGGVGQWNGAAGSTKPHVFTCSKCHSPHAAGLPALLITNCLDAQVSIANWRADVSLAGPKGGRGSNLTANNCHVKRNTTSGWHLLAPGLIW